MPVATATDTTVERILLLSMETSRFVYGRILVARR
jgi:hypothetical protein